MKTYPSPTQKLTSKKIVSPLTTTLTPCGGSFIMFSKDNKVNMSSMLGYYASIEYRNDSLEKAELFNVGAEVFESSK